MRRQHRWRRVTGAIVSVTLALLLTAGCGGGRAQPASTAAPELPHLAQATGRAVLELSATGVRWYGKPVYRLTNFGAERLQRVRVLSQTGDALPILGADGSAVTGPPHDLAPGASLWFVGPHPPPVQVTVMWVDDRGQAVWQVVRTS